MFQNRSTEFMYNKRCKKSTKRLIRFTLAQVERKPLVVDQEEVEYRGREVQRTVVEVVEHKRFVVHQVEVVHRPLVVGQAVIEHIRPVEGQERI